MLQTHHVQMGFWRMPDKMSGILQKPICPSLQTVYPDTPYTLILIDNADGPKLTTADTQTVTESSKHSDRISIFFYGHKRNPSQIKGALLQHSTTHAYAHTSHSKTQAEGGGM